MLLFGERIDDELGDCENNFGVSSICDVDEYMELCKMCFQKDVPTWMIAAFTRSIALHIFTSNIPTPEPVQTIPTLNLEDNKQEKINSLINLWNTSEIPDELLVTIMNLARNGESRLQSHALATLTTVKPSNFPSKILKRFLSLSPQRDEKNKKEHLEQLLTKLQQEDIISNINNILEQISGNPLNFILAVARIRN